MTAYSSLGIVKLSRTNFGFLILAGLTAMTSFTAFTALTGLVGLFGLVGLVGLVGLTGVGAAAFTGAFLAAVLRTGVAVVF